MRESQQVLEWQEEARKEGELKGKAKGKAEAILSTLEHRLGAGIPSDLAKKVLGTTDLATLDAWYDLAWTVASLKEFRKGIES